jgi:hypothetical protein
VPATLRTVLTRLAQHGVRSRAVARDTAIAAERFAIDSTWVAEREYQTHRERTITGSWRAEPVQLQAGEYVLVEMAQPLARLIFYLLEPRSDDGLASWNALERELQGAKQYPILRVPR